MQKTSKIYKSFMTIMIVAIAGMLIAMGIIAIQKNLKLKTSIDFLPGINVEIFVKNEDNPDEALIFRNFEDVGKSIEYNPTYCSISGTTLTMNADFSATFGNNFSFVIKNFSGFGVEIAITSTTTAQVGEEQIAAILPEITPATATIDNTASQEFVVTCEPLIPQTTIFTIQFVEVPVSENMMISGTEFNLLAKKINNTGLEVTDSEYYINTITFDTWNSDYQDKFGVWDAQEVKGINDTITQYDSSQVIDVSLDADQSVRMYLENADADNYIENVYVLSQGTILANTDCSDMFNYLYEVTSLDLSNFDTSKVTNMAYMFYNCCWIEEINMGNLDTSNVVDMSCMFYSCRLRTLDLSNFDTSKVTNMAGMFAWCSCIEDLNISGFDTSNVTDMSDMFNNCYRLQGLDLSSWDTSSVTNMSNMFLNCYALVELDLSNFDTSNVLYMYYMFSGCYALETLNCDGFDTSSVISMDSMFSDCKALVELDVSGFDTSNVTNMWKMFSDCHTLVELDLSGFDTSSVTDMSHMFSGCNALVELDLSGWDTSSVEDMRSMFKDCQALVELDLSGFDTSSVTSMSRMFYYCSNLTTIYASDKWSTAKVISSYSSSMFENCTSLPNFNSSVIDKTNAHYGAGGYLTYKAAPAV